MGISTAGTRLDQIPGYFEELRNPAAPEANPLSARAQKEDTYYALNDEAGFGQIAAEMSKLPSHLQFIKRSSASAAWPSPGAASSFSGFTPI